MPDPLARWQAAGRHGADVWLAAAAAVLQRCGKWCHHAKSPATAAVLALGARVLVGLRASGRACGLDKRIRSVYGVKALRA